jgi:3-oxoacyl-[acyl-carrier-protein] synthase-1
MNRVVITGMGIYSTIGENLDEVAKSLYAGKSGIVLDPKRKELGFRSGLTGKINRPVLKGLLSRRNRVGLAEQGEYAYIATMEALKNAGMDEQFLNDNEVGILYGNDSSSTAVIEAADLIREKLDTMLIGSANIFQSMNCTVSMNLSVILKLKGINFTISGACASGSHSIGMGYLLIKQGLQDSIICGGAQEINALSMGSFDALNAFSVREDDPTRASRPFDRDRDGLVPSGGAATVILESYESAKKRGAPILGEILGYGFSSNGEHISVPNVDGPVKSLERALKDASLTAREIDYLNAHATSTPVGDQNEAKALFKLFDQGKVHISSTKGMTGHEMWMGGASEVIYSMLMAKNSFIAPNLNFENPDEHSAKLNIVTKTIDKKINTFVSNSFGFGGTNSTLVVKSFQ